MEGRRQRSPVQEGDQGEAVVQDIDPLPRIKSEFVIDLPARFLLSGSVRRVVQRVLLLKNASKRSRGAEGSPERDRRGAHLEDLGVCPPGAEPVCWDDAALKRTVGVGAGRGVLTLGIRRC